MSQGQAPAALSALTKDEAWPALPLAEWEDTRATLHMWTQMAGKVSLALSPRVNHCWAEALHISPRGLTTPLSPTRSGSSQSNSISSITSSQITTSRNESKTMALAPRTVADFYREFMAALASLKIDVEIWPMPVEIPNPIRFDKDTQHASYDPGPCESLLAHPHECRHNLRGVSGALYRESQPRAFLLGKLRPRRVALFGAPRAGTSRHGRHGLANPIRMK